MNWFLDNEILLAIILLAGLALTWYAWQWWSGLDSDATAPSQ
jgi:TRAP-type C4-dicarboxylate transport system permease small subunit